MQIIHTCRQLKCMSPGPKHVAKCLVCRKQWMKAVISLLHLTEQIFYGRI